MEDYLAICTRCKKSIFVEKTPSGEYHCPACGINFDFDIKNKVGFLIDVDLSNEAYQVGQEYFLNTDFREALRYFNRALSINPNHYPAVYQAHMCKIYEEEQYSPIDIGPMMAEAIVDSVDKVIKARVNANNRINFLSLILKQSYIMLSKYYARRSTELIQKEDWSNLRTVSLDLADALNRVVSLDKESMMATNPSIVTSCLGIADIGISACQFVVLPRLDFSRPEAHILDMPTEAQFKKAKSLYSIFYYYAQNLHAGFSCSQKTDYGPVLYFIDNYVLPKRRQYYRLNNANQPKFLSMHGELLNALIADSTFAARYAHRLCYQEFLSNPKDESRMLLIYESVDNCLDSLMPRVRLAKDKKVDIVCKGYDTAVQMAIWLNDFLKDMVRKDSVYAAQKIDAFFGYIYNCIKKYYDLVSKKYREKLQKSKYHKTHESKYYFNFLHQVARCGMLAFLIEEVDSKINDNYRSKLLIISKSAVDEFAKLNETEFRDGEKGKFSDIVEVFEILRDANIYFEQLEQKLNRINKTLKNKDRSKQSKKTTYSLHKRASKIDNKADTQDNQKQSVA